MQLQEYLQSKDWNLMNIGFELLKKEGQYTEEEKATMCAGALFDYYRANGAMQTYSRESFINGFLLCQ